MNLALMVTITSACFFLAAILSFVLAQTEAHPTVPPYWRHALRNIGGMLASVGALRIANAAGLLSGPDLIQDTGIAVLAFTMLLAANVWMCRVEHRLKR